MRACTPFADRTGAALRCILEESGCNHMADTVTPPHDISETPAPQFLPLEIHPLSSLQNREIWPAPCTCHMTLAKSLPTGPWLSQPPSSVGLPEIHMIPRNGWPTAESLITSANIPRGLLGAGGGGVWGAREREDSATTPPSGEELGRGGGAGGKIRWWEGKRIVRK